MSIVQSKTAVDNIGFGEFINGLKASVETQTEKTEELDPLLKPDVGEVEQVLVATESYQQMFREHDAVYLVSMVATHKVQEPRVHVIKLGKGGAFEVKEQGCSTEIQASGLRDKEWVGRIAHWLAKSPLYIAQVVRMMNFLVKENQVLREMVKEAERGNQAE